MQRHL